MSAGGGGGHDYDFNGYGFHDFHFRDPEEVFREFFGGRDPFAEFFAGKTNKIFVLHCNFMKSTDFNFLIEGATIFALHEYVL